MQINVIYVQRQCTTLWEDMFCYKKFLKKLILQSPKTLFTKFCFSKLCQLSYVSQNGEVIHLSFPSFECQTLLSISPGPPIGGQRSTLN